MPRRLFIHPLPGMCCLGTGSRNHICNRPSFLMELRALIATVRQPLKGLRRVPLQMIHHPALSAASGLPYLIPSLRLPATKMTKENCPREHLPG
jgi:hypothetical protein